MFLALEVMKKYQVLFLVVVVILLLTACGKDLSRSKAEKMIKESMKENPKTMELELGNENGIIRFTYPGQFYYQQGHQQNNLGDKFIEDNRKLTVLAENGLLTYKAVATFHDDAAERHPGDPSRFYYDEYLIELTPKAKAYILKEEKRQNWNRYNKIVTVLLAEIDKVEVTGITKPSEGFGQNMCGADFKIIYKPTPFGDVFLNKRDLIREGQAPFVLYDNGWRLAQ